MAPLGMWWCKVVTLGYNFAKNWIKTFMLCRAKSTEFSKLRQKLSKYTYINSSQKPLIAMLCNAFTRTEFCKCILAIVLDHAHAFVKVLFKVALWFSLHGLGLNWIFCVNNDMLKPSNESPKKCCMSALISTRRQNYSTLFLKFKFH